MPLLRGMKTALNLWYGPAAQALVLACLGLAVLLLLNFSYGAAAAAMLVPPLLLASAPGGGPRRPDALHLQGRRPPPSAEPLSQAAVQVCTHT